MGFFRNHFENLQRPDQILIIRKDLIPELDNLINLLLDFRIFALNPFHKTSNFLQILMNNVKFDLAQSAVTSLFKKLHHVDQGVILGNKFFLIVVVFSIALGAFDATIREELIQHSDTYIMPTN